MVYRSICRASLVPKLPLVAGENGYQAPSPEDRAEYAAAVDECFAKEGEIEIE
jgi:hypothetical protein